MRTPFAQLFTDNGNDTCTSKHTLRVDEVTIPKNTLFTSQTDISWFHPALHIGNDLKVTTHPEAYEITGFFSRAGQLLQKEPDFFIQEGLATLSHYLRVAP